MPECVCVNIEAVGWKEAEGKWKGNCNGEHMHSQASKVMKKTDTCYGPCADINPCNPKCQQKLKLSLEQPTRAH